MHTNTQRNPDPNPRVSTIRPSTDYHADAEPIHALEVIGISAESKGEGHRG